MIEILSRHICAHNPNNGFYQRNTLWQQILWTAISNSQEILSTRSRLEEGLQSHQSQPFFLLRERISLELIRQYYGKINPAFYDEIFFQLNRTNYFSHQLVRENRLFLGINLYTTQTNFFQIGYLNQYEFSKPGNNTNQMNHVLVVNYNIT